MLIIQAFLFTNVSFGIPQDNTPAPVQQEIITNPDQVVIPRECGLVKSKYNGTAGALVIHIQDAHCNYEAQSNIVKILEALVKNYKLKFVSVEGADGVIDTSWFKAFPDDVVRKEVADYFMKKGEITGPEYLSITTDLPVKLFGAETRAYYIENLNAFTSSYPLKADTEKYFSQIKAALSKLKDYIYNDDLKAFDAKSSDYETKRIQFNDYVRFLQSEADKYKINLRAYDNFFKLVNVLVYERKIDFNVVDKERGTLIDELSKALAKDAMTELVGQSIAFKVGKISSADYYNYLKALAIKSGFDLAKDYPNLYNYIIYNSVYSRIENEKLFHDIKVLETDLKEKVFQNDDQRALEKLSRHIETLIGLVNIKLLNGDFEYFKQHKDEFTYDYFNAFIQKKVAQFGFAFEVTPPTDAVAKSIEHLEEFYVVAIKRDRALVDNTVEAMKKDEQKIAVLVTGGFHSEGIAKLLEKQGISYMVVCPSITKDVPSPYIQILTNQRTPLEDILVGTVEAKENTKDSMLAPILRSYCVALLDDGAFDTLNGITDRTQLEAHIRDFQDGWIEFTINGVRIGEVQVAGYIDDVKKNIGAISVSVDDILASFRTQVGTRTKRLVEAGAMDEAARTALLAKVDAVISKSGNIADAMRARLSEKGTPGTASIGEIESSLVSIFAYLQKGNMLKISGNKGGALDASEADQAAVLNANVLFGNWIQAGRPAGEALGAFLSGRNLEQVSRGLARIITANGIGTPGTGAVDTNLDSLTVEQARQLDEVLKQSYAEGTYREYSAQELGVTDPALADFRLVVHYGLEARIKAYNKEHGTDLPIDRIPPGRGGIDPATGKTRGLRQAHISGYRFEKIMGRAQWKEIMARLITHEAAHLDLFNANDMRIDEKVRKIARASAAFTKRDLEVNRAMNEEDFVDLVVPGANTREAVFDGMSVRDLLAEIDAQHADATTTLKEEALIVDTTYGTAVKDEIMRVRDAIIAEKDITQKKNLRTQLDNFVNAVFDILAKIDTSKNMLKEPYDGYDIILISSTTEGEAAHQQAVLDKLFAGLKTKNANLKNRVCVLSVLDESEGGQIIGQIVTWEHAKAAFAKWAAANGLDVAGLDTIDKEGLAKIVTYHNGGKAERFSPGGQASNLSRASQLLMEFLDAQKNARGEPVALDLLTGIIRSSAQNAERPRTTKGARQDVYWANQQAFGDARLTGTDYELDKFAVAVPKEPNMKDLYDYGTFIVTDDGRIKKFLANKVLTKLVDGQYIPNKDYIDDYKELLAAAQKGKAFFDYGSYSMSRKMFEALYDYWVNVRHMLEIMKQNGNKADKSRDIDPKFVQIIVPLVNGLVAAKTMPEGLPSAETLRTMLPGKAKYALLDKAYDELLKTINPGSEYGKALAAIYKKDKEGVLDVIDFFLIYKDDPKFPIFKDLSKVIGYIDMGPNTIWFAYKRMLDMANEKFLMLADINGSVFEIGAKGEAITRKADARDGFKAMAARRLREISADKVAAFELAGR